MISKTEETPADAALQPGPGKSQAPAAGEIAVGSPDAARKRGKPKMPENDPTLQRKARAAKKLKENLMRRKQQSRARRAGDADEGFGLPAAKTTDDAD